MIQGVTGPTGIQGIQGPTGTLGELGNLTISEVQQLENINTNTIGTTNWVYLANILNQHLMRSSNVTFGSLTTPIIYGETANNMINHLGNPGALVNNNWRVVSYDNATLFNVSSENGGNAIINGNLSVNGTGGISGIKCLFGNLSDLTYNLTWLDGTDPYLLLEFVVDVTGTYYIKYMANINMITSKIVSTVLTLNGTNLTTNKVSGMTSVANIVGINNCCAQKVISLTVNDILRLYAVPNSSMTAGDILIYIDAYDSIANPDTSVSMACIKLY